jgi:hypothetical protein
VVAVIPEYLKLYLPRVDNISRTSLRSFSLLPILSVKCGGFASNRRLNLFILRLFFAASMDIRVVAKLIQLRIGEKPADLDQLLESMGLRLDWHEKLHAVSGRLLVRRK